MEGPTMVVSELAGRPAEPGLLIDVDRLVGAYFDRRPDPAIPSERVAFGTSGHRGSSLTTSFNEAHILAISAAICRYRRREGIAGPLFICLLYTSDAADEEDSVDLG